jgi:hypothetical protein
MHQSLVSGSAQCAEHKKQLDELTSIGYRQAHFILELERQNAVLRALAVPGRSKIPSVTVSANRVSRTALTTTPTASLGKKSKKRKRDEKGGRQDEVPCVDGLGNRLVGRAQEKQRGEREKKVLKLRKQRDNSLEDNDEDE